MRAAQTYEPVGRAIRWDADPAQRFGISARDFAGATAQGGGPQASGGLHWQTPPGWTELPPAQFREANFKVAGNADADCYLTRLSGTAGGLEANVNRWRAQVSLDPLTAAQIAGLRRVEWLGGEAVYVDFDGQWKGMSGDQAEAGWRLVGLLAVRPDESLFFKMVGPAAVIGAEVEAFQRLAQSLHGGDGHDHGKAQPGSPLVDPVPEAPVQSGTTRAKTGSLPPDHPPIGAEPKPVPVAAEDTLRSESLTWIAPKGWQRAPDRTMREVTYQAGGAECYVTLLAGDGGGALANINRWCGQMGADALDDARLATLERVPMHGAEGRIVRLARGPSATAAATHEALLGAVCILPEHSVFVKMAGPAAAVDAQKASFVEFCKSLQPVN
ncbi:MAG: hypothetical protein NTY35_02260 [Planctomycetota bacterium]|nr:hypothetical protein [Planctomycetota bacterium]